VTVLVRFKGLVARGFVNSWPQLRRLQEHHSFPEGRMLSPGVRVWTEAELDAWFETRPTSNNGPLKGAAKIKHERKAALAAVEAVAPAPLPLTEPETGPPTDLKPHAPPSPSEARQRPKPPAPVTQPRPTPKPASEPRRPKRRIPETV
jgi:hypothetical protein